MIGAVISAMFFHYTFDVLDHDDGIVDHNSDREDDGEQRDRVCGISYSQQHNERTDQAHRHSERRYQRGAYTTQKEVDNEHHENECLNERLADLMNGVGNKLGRVVSNLPSDILGKSLLGCFKLSAHRL
jgi:hypothetical protein